ncbi:coiled-coil protein [Trema orientale]|uniref:Coiled-coil protein n=1 Tax=Trema orientale TaxID=63057 RepID=A0A2P5EG51_TREOI|nr:coiled-coil protein [Trema orientale]
MSFLAGRLAGKEGAYFFQESKQAVGRLVAHKKPPSPPPTQPSSSSSPATEHEAQADVLPEVLRHSLPSKLFQETSNSAPSMYSASKWGLPSDPNSAFSLNAEALNPLRAYVSLPQVTFGPKRWQLPELNNGVSASTANELRRDRYPPVNPEKLKAAAEGLQQIGKAFAIATAVVFGGATLMFGMAVSMLELQNSDAIRTKGRDLVEPSLEIVRKQLDPLKDWAANMSKKWRLERAENVKESPMIKELTKILGAKPSN